MARLGTRGEGAPAGGDPDKRHYTHRAQPMERGIACVWHVSICLCVRVCVCSSVRDPERER